MSVSEPRQLWLLHVNLLLSSKVQANPNVPPSPRADDTALLQ